jgi:hypothetical protein
MKTIIDFIIDCVNDRKIAENFQIILKDANSIIELKAWFESNKYNVTDDECIRLFENRVKITDPSVTVKEY